MVDRVLTLCKCARSASAASVAADTAKPRRAEQIGAAAPQKGSRTDPRIRQAPISAYTAVLRDLTPVERSVHFYHCSSVAIVVTRCPITRTTGHIASVDAIANVANELLFLARVEAGELRLDPDTGEIATLGRDGHWRVARPSGDGYVRVVRSFDGAKRTCMAHRLLWAACVGPIGEGLQVNHKSGDRGDNRLSNLEIVTPAENTRHARDVLSRYWGAANGMCRYSMDQILEIRQRLAAGESRESIAEAYGCSSEYVRLLRDGRRRRKELAEIAEMGVAA
jgi:hypothetical protein